MEEGVLFPVDGLVHVYIPSVFINAKQTNWVFCHSISFDAEYDIAVQLFFIVQLATIKQNCMMIMYNIIYDYLCICICKSIYDIQAYINQMTPHEKPYQSFTYLTFNLFI